MAPDELVPTSPQVQVRLPAAAVQALASVLVAVLSVPLRPAANARANAPSSALPTTGTRLELPQGAPPPDAAGQGLVADVGDVVGAYVGRVSGPRRCIPAAEPRDRRLREVRPRSAPSVLGQGRAELRRLVRRRAYGVLPRREVLRAPEAGASPLGRRPLAGSRPLGIYAAYAQATGRRRPLQEGATGV